MALLAKKKSASNQIHGLMMLKTNFCYYLTFPVGLLLNDTIS